tara:strand:- start:2452 stop:2703 length:252 start_codon:yes stop_codon:yes gene_type:complete
MMIRCKEDYELYTGEIIFKRGNWYIVNSISEEGDTFCYDIACDPIKSHGNQIHFKFRSENNITKYFYNIQELREREIDKVLKF